MEKKELPKYWCVKNDGSQLFKDTVVKYINQLHTEGLIGDNDNYYYGVVKNFIGYDINESPFGEELTIDEFIDIVYPELKDPKMKDYYLVSRNTLKKLYDSSSVTAKAFIKDIANSEPFSDTIKVSYNDIEVLSRAIYKDKNIFKDTFHEYLKDLKNVKVHKLDEAINKVCELIDEQPIGYNEECIKILFDAYNYKPE